VKHPWAIAVVLFIPTIGQVHVSPTHAAVPDGTFRAETELVALTVTVTDSRQQPIGNLTAADFVVLDEGVQQPVTFFAVGEVPLDLTLLVDASSSMRDKMDVAREAVRGLARKLRPDDRVSVVEFRDAVVERQEMTQDRKAVEAALDQMTAQGGTALYNALYVALTGVKEGTGPDGRVRRQSIVVLSDGEDTSSLVGYEDVLEKARRRGATIYSVSLRSPVSLGLARGRPDGLKALTEADYVMRSLARETGGQCFFPVETKELKAIYAAISTELGQQYAIGFTPRSGTRDGGWRRLNVRVPSHPEARLRTRSGYFAESTGRVALATARSSGRSH
jgi:Ca-activated chloride channel family protein